MESQNNGQLPAQQQANSLKRFSEETIGNVLDKVSKFQTEGGIKLPANYSAENAVRSAWLIIQEVKDMNKKPALEVCSKDSVATALLDMVLQGLNPVKKQCYFVVYGGKLTLQKSYIGNIMIAKKVANVKEVKGVPVYQGDEFEYEINLDNGRKTIKKHVQKFENIDPANTVGAYAIVTESDGKHWAEVMNMKQIQSAWNMGNAKGNSPAHNGFKDEMACKTVINRALKLAIGSTDDSSLFEDEEVDDMVGSGVRHEIGTNANKTQIGFNEDNSSGNDQVEQGQALQLETSESVNPI